MRAMEEYEIRARSAEISVIMCAHLTAASISKYGTGAITLIEPLGLAKDIEAYIRSGNIPKPIEVTHE